MRVIPAALRMLAKSIVGQVKDAIKTEREPVAVKKYEPIFLGFARWRSNPNWPGRRAAAARRTAGKTRRMR